MRYAGRKRQENILRSRLNLRFQGTMISYCISTENLYLIWQGNINPLEGHINFETGAVDVYGLNKDGATEDGYPINKISIMHRRIFMKKMMRTIRV